MFSEFLGRNLLVVVDFGGADVWKKLGCGSSLKI